MNNIEILEEYIKEVWKPKPIHNVIPDWATIEKEEIQAIENLIQENEELKEKIKGLECESEIRKYCKVDEVINDLTYYKNLAKEYQGNCIPKSKIKQKIKELNEEYEMYVGREYSGMNDLILKIKTLENLLEE